ncbi:regulator of G-protein signaling [Zalerion maritima]|uniref:Regulator of G-protein signaling n=1 Tax=Zalerion maritima TaxID=339359 RepID=A0AAD5RPF5_9PEZI|nr:regulator of G-protein signaling [Zalerion maritima]
MEASRPTSLAFLETASSCSKLPTLAEILSNSAPPPWTLSAFMAYLSQNHCLETLEFTMDADRYRTAYQDMRDGRTAWLRDGNHHLCSLWQKLIMAYIVPCAPREVNLPAPVRDRLLARGCCDGPPEPTVLGEAVRIVYELMSDSVLMPFLESVAPKTDGVAVVDAQHDSRQGRPRARTNNVRMSRSGENSRSPKASFLPQLSIGRHGATSRSASSSADPADREMLTDDSGDAGSPGMAEPMTPPTTPPTSDWTFNASPNTIQRAISAHNSGWKKMGAKLGFVKKSRSSFARRNTSNSSLYNNNPQNNSECDVAMGDANIFPAAATAISSNPTTTSGCNSTGPLISGPGLLGENCQPEWEEPHPGRRLPLPGETSLSGDGSAIPRAECRDGMAAKAALDGNPQPRTAKRRARLRSRKPNSRSLLVPDKVPEEVENRILQANTSPPTVHYMSAPLLNTSDPARDLDAPIPQPEPSRSAADGGGIKECQNVCTPITTDFSNDLSLEIEENDDNVFGIVDLGFCCDVSADDDFYGWDAELARRQVGSIPNSFELPQHFNYRRADGGRKNLLHRVLSLGQASTSPASTPI